jgi:CDP-4-dehydro-6-deoxyglucose reductase, E1
VNKTANLRKEIISLVREYYKEAFPPVEFVPGKTYLHYSGRVFDDNELASLVESGLEFWLTEGRFAESFANDLAAFTGVKHVILVNSGSSANLLAMACLTSTELGDRRLNSGAEVITVSAGFPTTVNPIIQTGMVPVFVDVTVPEYNIDVKQLEDAFSAKTGAVMLAHTLGNPFNIKAVLDFVRRHDLWLIEDCCDALGSLYNGQKVGTFGDIATLSFYPAHHITTGEGGAVLTKSPHLANVIKSFRDWGRDCQCEPGEDNSCGKRFDNKIGGLPFGYDHKYVYSEIGYNLKMTDLQAAIGVAQMKKLPHFIERRIENYNYLYQGFRAFENKLMLPGPTAGSEPAWFGFPLAVREDAGFSRNQIVRYLEERKIATRLLFGGNLIKQPAYRKVNYRIAGNLTNTDFVLNNVFWLGVYPGFNRDMLDYVLRTVGEFINGR